MPNRSAKTGRYISNAAAARHPNTSVRETGGNNHAATLHRSAANGQFVTAAAVNRNPNGTLTERGK
jgi:hypothetical protein